MWGDHTMKRTFTAVTAAVLLAGLTACGGGGNVEAEAEALSPTAAATLTMIESRMAAATAAERKFACEGDWADVLSVADLPYKASGPQAKFAKNREAAAEAYLSTCSAS